MSQPSQEFPPWLSPSAVVITDAAGNPVATETTIVYVTPTYFGPSIPLGSLYIFGGTTEPPSIALPSPAPETTTTTPPSISTTATPTTTLTTILTTSATHTSSSLSSSISASVTSATPSSSSILSSASSVSLSTSTASSSSSESSNPSSSVSSSPSTSIASSPTPSNAPVAIHAAGLSRGQLVGVIVASILGLIFLFVLALFLFLCLKGRKNRRQFTALETPIDEDYYIIPSGSRPPGEGSPRHSGEEADPFLQRSSGPGPHPYAANVQAPVMTQVPSQAASRNSATRIPPPPVPTAGSHSSGSTNSNASGFGELLDRPSLGMLPSMPEHQETGGTRLSPSEMARIGRESVLPDNADQYEQYGDPEYTGAFAYSQDLPAPPRLVGSAPSSPLFNDPQIPPRPSKLSNKSSLGPSDPEETATLLTARRVRVEDLGPRTTPSHSSSTAGPSTGFLGALGGLASNLGRLSWFKGHDSPRGSMSTTPNYVVDPLSEKDIETGRSFLSPNVRPVDSFGNRARGLGVGADGTRPTSTVSGRSGASGGTLYHDAQSSLPGTPSLPVPPPRAITPAEPMPTEQSYLASPPAYTDRPLASSTPPPASSGPPDASNLNNTTTDDILDMPAPAALNHFANISSSSSARDPAMRDSFGSGTSPSFPPPGLETIKVVGWADSANGGVPSSSLSMAAAGVGLSSGLERDEHQAQAPISIDILEEAPPDAEQGWRTISSGHSGSDSGRRGTFGMFMHGHGGISISSEQASLHSMRSHFTPSNRSTGSAAASRHDMGSIRSNSSRPSAHSVALSIGSGVSSAAAAHSLLRTGSISSDERNRFSPSLSAFGHGGHQLRTSSNSNSNSHSQSHSGHGSQVLLVPQEPPLAPIIGTPPSAHMSPDKSSSKSTTRMQTIRPVASGSGSVAGSGSGSLGSPTVLDNSFDTTRPGPGASGGLQHERSISPSNTSFSFSMSGGPLPPWAGGLAE